MSENEIKRIPGTTIRKCSEKLIESAHSDRRIHECGSEYAHALAKHLCQDMGCGKTWSVDDGSFINVYNQF